ncbi:hypothetical protein Zm00014a_043119 [Zea mays]|uniref:Uncharacterized protein n=1 Tax=Zea mays TaxID=4577 RepID=A0A3L6FX23_MAIZE|nr:hypothetical protein Zm00014a_043119 [Zea mays]
MRPQPNNSVRQFSPLHHTCPSIISEYNY